MLTTHDSILNMRAFIAINLSEKIKNKIAELENDLKKCDLAFRWVKPENLHLTLKFLGNVNEEQVTEIKKIIAKVTGRFTAFETGFNGFSFFPNETRPKVFFISIDKEDFLKSIAKELGKELETLGFEKENLSAGGQGRFKSHITLARIKGLQNIEYFKEKIKNIQLDAGFPINEIILYKSTLAKEGPIHGKIFKSNLTA